MYGTRSNGNKHGIVLTKRSVVKDMLDLVDYRSDRNLEKIKVVEPASGDGAFALEIIERLFKSSVKYDFSFEQALGNLAFYEIEDNKVQELTENINSLLETYGAAHSSNLVYQEDFLLAKRSKCNIVIGNPPYVRHENIPENLKQSYKKKFRTFRHRSDLYIPFFEKGLELLARKGQLCFICSNRWLKNQYGSSLRELISLKYSLESIVDLESTNPFQEPVTAYPSIFNISNERGTGKAHYYEVSDLRELTKIAQGARTYHHKLSVNTSNWFSDFQADTESISNLETIENQGFKIGIGVATGCDRVFISKSFGTEIEKELLLPILTSKDLRGDNLEWHGTSIVNPFSTAGKLIDLEKYPRAKEYFEKNSEALKRRHISKKSPHKWYRTIDKIDSKLTGKPKIILPDISGNKFIFIDKGDFYPHHNLYYITGKSYKLLKVLAAILLSDSTRAQLSRIGNKMNGGYPRWQAQYLKKLRIPLISSLPTSIVDEITDAYDAENIEKINALINHIQSNEYSQIEGQLHLF